MTVRDSAVHKPEALARDAPSLAPYSAPFFPGLSSARGAFGDSIVRRRWGRRARFSIFLLTAALLLDRLRRMEEHLVPPLDSSPHPSAGSSREDPDGCLYLAWHCGHADCC